MIYLIFQDFFSQAGLGLRIGGAGVMSFLLVLLFGKKIIRLLIKRKIGDVPEFDHKTLNEITKHKSNTPTMGGLLIVAAMFVSIMFFGNLGNMYIKSGLFALIWLGLLGGVDDWLKLRAAAGHGGRDGLKSWEKFVFQVALAVLLSNFVYRYGRGGLVIDGQLIVPAHSFYIPMFKKMIALSFPVYAVIMTLVMVGSSNAVNLSDGMDGLAAGNLLITTVVFLVISWMVGVVRWAELFSMPFVPHSAEMTVLCSAMIGALLGFMWFNAPPAAVFMGDTGSLPLGGLLGYIAVITRQEFILIVAGGVFVMEALSVLIQVGCFKYYKRFRGEEKRIFRCAPIHHHFHLCGWPETKIVIRFWIIGIILAVASLAILKLGSHVPIQYIQFGQ